MPSSNWAAEIFCNGNKKLLQHHCRATHYSTVKITCQNKFYAHNTKIITVSGDGYDNHNGLIFILFTCIETTDSVVYLRNMYIYCKSTKNENMNRILKCLMKIKKKKIYSLKWSPHMYGNIRSYFTNVYNLHMPPKNKTHGIFLIIYDKAKQIQEANML